MLFFFLPNIVFLHPILDFFSRINTSIYILILLKSNRMDLNIISMRQFKYSKIFWSWRSFFLLLIDSHLLRFKPDGWSINYFYKYEKGGMRKIKIHSAYAFWKKNPSDNDEYYQTHDKILLDQRILKTLFRTCHYHQAYPNYSKLLYQFWQLVKTAGIL